MAVICSIGVAVGAYIWAALTAASVFVAAITVYVAVLTANIVIWLGSVIVGGVLGVLEAIGMVTFSQSMAVLDAIGLMNATAVSSQLAVWAFVETIATAWGMFAEAIHLKTVIKMHNIAMAVSRDYRLMMQGFYQTVGELSEAMGLGFGYLPLALRNARAIVLDVSGFFGRSYDLAELEWLQTISAFSEEMSQSAWAISRKPEFIFELIDHFITEPVLDNKGAGARALYSFVESLVEVASDTVADVVQLRTHVDKFIMDLPEELENKIRPEFDRVAAEFDEWIADSYGPALATVGGLFRAVGKELDDGRTVAAQLIKSLKRPGSLLQGTALLPEAERLEQEDMIYNAANKTPGRMAGDLSAVKSEPYKTLQMLADALKVVMPPVEWSVPELEGIQFPPGTSPELRITWFVGDY